jgi:hypothetical protein
MRSGPDDLRPIGAEGVLSAERVYSFLCTKSRSCIARVRAGAVWAMQADQMAKGYTIHRRMGMWHLQILPLA